MTIKRDKLGRPRPHKIKAKKRKGRSRRDPYPQKTDGGWVKRREISTRRFGNKDMMIMRQLKNDGWSLRQIAAEFGCSYETVRLILNKQLYRKKVDE